MACCSAVLHHPLGFSLTPCSASRAPPRIQRVGVATPSAASARPLSRARISPRCTYSGGASAAPGPGELPAAALRRVLEMPGAHQAPACYDALSARLVERAEFRACFTSGTWSIFCRNGGRGLLLVHTIQERLPSRPPFRELAESVCL
jgi:hypothetical protein